MGLSFLQLSPAKEIEIKGALEAIQRVERRTEIKERKEGVRRMERKLRENTEKLQMNVIEAKCVAAQLQLMAVQPAPFG